MDKKVLVYRDQNQIDNERPVLKELLPKYYEFHELFNGLNIGLLDVATLKNLNDIDLDELVLKKIESKLRLKKVAGFKQDKRAILNTLELPDLSRLKLALSPVGLSYCDY